MATRKRSKKKGKKRTVQRKTASIADRPGCGLCGKTGNVTRTECCGHWICDDEHEYVPFSYARTSCFRNHRRYTLCGYHYVEEYEGNWKNCATCRDDFETELYVYYGINEYNFEKLKNPPDYEPTRCAKCNRVISLGEDGYTISGADYLCEHCFRMF